ncbi:FadR/GntR family transcriptional regulator [Aquibacillus sediminis]|uniref:FadR/GntR family transcriptional regulator n=1 Tax=Aquibacillus sediminis TaxID=2574734 RepID=UPI00110903EE|nr:FadR/GntR family transcriptional regulator [Aquibacillus sediminis]
MFKNIKNERVYEKIVNQIYELIQEGDLKSGERLPAERDLANTLSCSRSSLREAFRVLESKGLIISKAGGGRFVQNVDQKIINGENFNTLDLLEKSAMVYFIEAREAFEPRIVELACKRANNQDISKIENALKIMKEKLKYPDIKISADNNFHVSLAEATHNFVFVSMMETNINMIREVRKKIMKNPDRYQESVKEHTEIFDAIKNRDVLQAVEKTNTHLRNLKENVIKNCDLK